MEDIPPLRDDIDPLLALIQKPESLPLAFQAIHAYRVRMQELLASAKRAEAERTEREVRLNRFDGFTDEASRKSRITIWPSSARSWRGNSIATVTQERQRLKATLHRLAKDEERPECGG